MDATPQTGFQPEVQGKEVFGRAGKPRFIVVSELLFAVDSLADVPTGRVVVEAPNGELKEMDTARIPSDRMLTGIEDGRVYAPWGANLVRLHALHPDWALSGMSRRRTSRAWEREWPHSERPIAAKEVEDAALITALEEGTATAEVPSSASGMHLKVNHQGTVVELHADTLKDLYELALLKAETEPLFLKAKAYGACAKALREKHPELGAADTRGRTSETKTAKQGTLL